MAIATTNGQARPVWKDRTCPCGETFTPTGPRQRYHAPDCPARGAGTSEVARSRDLSPRQRKSRSAEVKEQGRQAARERLAQKDSPSIVVRLLGECDQELSRIDEELVNVDRGIAALEEERDKLRIARGDAARAKRALQV